MFTDTPTKPLPLTREQRERQRLPFLWDVQPVTRTAFLAEHRETHRTLAIVQLDPYTAQVTSPNGEYIVEAENGCCSCPDAANRAHRMCYHQAACLAVRQHLCDEERDLAAVEARRAATARKLEHLHRLMAA